MVCVFFYTDYVSCTHSTDVFNLFTRNYTTSKPNGTDKSLTPSYPLNFAESKSDSKSSPQFQLSRKFTGKHPQKSFAKRPT